MSSVQPSQIKGTLHPGASGRRDPNDHRGQGTGDLGFRCARRLVSALAIDRRRQTKLPQHAGPISRPLQPNESPSYPLITTDGFKFYERVIGRVFGPACVYGQVIKTRRNDRVVRVERRAVIGAGRLKQALRNSEDSVKLNTSFVERLNLTIRQGSSYLGRRTLCQARGKQYLDDHLELLR